MTELAGKSVLVVGLGTSGFAAARILSSLDAKVRVTEAATDPAIEQRAAILNAEGVEVEFGGHDLDRLDADLAVVSPGVPPHALVVAELRARRIELISEVELAHRLGPGCTFLAVTGTNGKTTTTTLLAAMLREGGVRSTAAGNIGTPLIEAVFEMEEGGVIAVETSSFQLETTQSFRPRVGVILNIAEDHTDWHGTFEAYVAAKARIAANQGPDDYLVVNADDARARAIAAGARSRTVFFSTTAAPPEGIGVRAPEILWKGEPFLSVADVPLPGHAGLEDVLAAAACALCFGVDPPSVARAVKGFRTLPHRLEVVAEADEITYIDDSKATNPHAALSAVRGMTNVVLIAGGRSKGIDLSALAGVVPPVVAVVVLGEAAEELRGVFSGLVPVERASDMQDAVRRARVHAIPRGSVLLSPGCASLDMYENYAQRGEDFARAVLNLLEETNGYA